MKTLAVVIGVVLLILAVLAWSGAVSFLPALGLDGKHHLKHGVLYLILAVLAFVWARMSTGTASAR